MEEQPIIVRPAAPNDGPDMGRVHVAAWQIGYRGVIPDSHLDGLDAVARGQFWADHLTQELTKPDDPATPDTAVAEVAGQVVGLTSYGPYRRSDAERPAAMGNDAGGQEDTTSDPDGNTDRFCELWSLNVDPDFWGTGVAQALMGHVIDELGRTRPEPTVALWVVDENGRGRRFYEKVGWTFDGWHKSEDFAGQTITELRYCRTL